jgi:hypothetical protein
MQKLITRDIWESDKRMDPYWWLEDDCSYCMSRNCRECQYTKKDTVYTLAY